MLMIGKPLTASQRLAKNVTEIMSRDYFIALNGLLMEVQHSIAKPEEGIPTACTNGAWAKYGEAFIAELSDAQFRFVILHETYHCMFKHLTTWDHLFKEDAGLANAACDYVINQMIVDAMPQVPGLLELPDELLLDEKFRGMNAGEVYSALKEEIENESQRGEGEVCEGEEGEGQGQPQQPGQPGQQGQSKSKQKGGRRPKGFDEHDWESAQEMTQAEKDELSRRIDEAVRQGALLASKAGSGGMREMDELLASKTRWQDELREYLHTACSGNEFSTWRRPNRRYVASNVYLPSGVSEKLGTVLVGIDTSGSIGSHELGQFLGEVKAICEGLRPEMVRLLYWDTAVCADEKYDQTELDNLTTTTKPAGGGGTAPSCVTDYMREQAIKPDVAIMLTDGYVGNDWGGAWPSPVVWCVVNNQSAQAPTGKTINVNIQ